MLTYESLFSVESITLSSVITGVLQVWIYFYWRGRFAWLLYLLTVFHFSLHYFLYKINQSYFGSNVENVQLQKTVLRPVLIKYSLSTINPGTTPQLSMSTRKQARKLDQCQTRAWSLQLSMSTGTQASNLSMPNQWARSLQPSMSTRTQARNLLIPNHLAQSYLYISFQSRSIF